MATGRQVVVPLQGETVADLLHLEGWRGRKEREGGREEEGRREGECLYVCVCVRESERERERGKEEGE